LHIKFRRWEITQKRGYNIQNTAKVWNQEEKNCAQCPLSTKLIQVSLRLNASDHPLPSEQLTLYRAPPERTVISRRNGIWLSDFLNRIWNFYPNGSKHWTLIPLAKCQMHAFREPMPHVASCPRQYQIYFLQWFHVLNEIKDKCRGSVYYFSLY
jgi:hypothetical protein